MNEQTRNLLEWLSGAPLRIFAVLLAAWVGRVVGARAITRAINKLATTDLKPGPGVAKRQAERARTTGSVLSSILNAVIWIIALAMVLGEFGFNLGPSEHKLSCAIFCQVSLCSLRTSTEWAMKSAS
ncbi:MAG: hypothetical protein RLZZ73_967 [Actinomycetota bacterium]